MMKRTLSLLRALIMVIGLVPVSFVQAAENNDVVYVDESTSMSDLVDKGLVQMDQPVTEPIMPETPTNQGLVTVPDLDHPVQKPVQESEKPEQTPESPAISFKGAFEINYFFTPANAVDGDMKLYFWNEDTYNAVSELTAENADKAVTMTLENGSYTASSDEIAAKYLDKTVYVAAVYESNGVSYCSGVLPYSIAAYCQNPPAGVQDLATAAAIYGCTAKQYFGV